MSQLDIFLLDSIQIRIMFRFQQHCKDGFLNSTVFGGTVCLSRPVDSLATILESQPFLLEVWKSFLLYCFGNVETHGKLTLVLHNNYSRT